MIISITDDFDMRKIADSGQCFRVKEIKPGLFRFITLDYVLYIKKLAASACESESVNDDLYEISCSKEEWNNIWINYFDLDRCYSDIRKSVPKSDSYMLKCAKFGTGIRILRQDPFEMLITFIISQQKKIPDIMKAVEKLCEKYGHVIHTPYEDLYSFPTIDEIKNITIDDIADVKLGYRSPYIIDAITRVYNGDLCLDTLYSLTDEDLFNSLLTVKGVGAKVANCICLFAYNRVAMAPIDTWIKKTIEGEYKGINPFPSYGNVAGIMQQYMFFHAKS